MKEAKQFLHHQGLALLEMNEKVSCVAISVRIDRFSRIELFPSIVLSSEKANYKNDIQ